ELPWPRHPAAAALLGQHADFGTGADLGLPGAGDLPGAPDFRYGDRLQLPRRRPAGRARSPRPPGRLNISYPAVARPRPPGPARSPDWAAPQPAARPWCRAAAPVRSPSPAPVQRALPRAPAGAPR